MFKQKNLKKMIVPVSALIALTAQNFGFYDVTSDMVEALFNSALALAIAFGIVANNDK